MEYEFIHDAVTGNAIAKFSFEHQVIGPWLEVEVGNCAEKLTKVLTAIEQVSTGQSQEELITGQEYTLVLSREDAQVQVNALLNGEASLPEELQDDNMNFDMQDYSTCGVDDFRTLLLSWARFSNI